MYGAAMPIAMVMGVGMWCLPPSPRWLLFWAAQGQQGSVDQLKDKAAEAIRKCGSSQASNEAVAKKIEETLASLEGGEVGFRELFRGVNRKALVVGTGLAFFQQVCFSRGCCFQHVLFATCMQVALASLLPCLALLLVVVCSLSEPAQEMNCCC